MLVELIEFPKTIFHFIGSPTQLHLDSHHEMFLIFFQGIFSVLMMSLVGAILKISRLVLLLIYLYFGLAYLYVAYVGMFGFYGFSETFGYVLYQYNAYFVGLLAAIGLITVLDSFRLGLLKLLDKKTISD